jgi:membrane protein required for colicin V production
MNQVDVLVLVLLAPFAFRGYWRGFCRESFGLVGLLGGTLAAAAGGGALADVLVARGLLPPLAALPAAAVAIFLAVTSAAALLGLFADRVVRAVLLGGVNRLAGVVFGTLKGAAFLGFLLIVAERYVASPSLAQVIASSTLGRPLRQIATAVLEAGRSLAAATAGGGA